VHASKNNHLPLPRQFTVICSRVLRALVTRGAGTGTTCTGTQNTVIYSSSVIYRTDTSRDVPLLVIVHFCRRYNVPVLVQGTGIPVLGVPGTMHGTGNEIPVSVHDTCLPNSTTSTGIPVPVAHYSKSFFELQHQYIQHTSTDILVPV
jgi:hypothetical protein